MNLDNFSIHIGASVTGEEKEGVRVSEEIIQDILFWRYLPLFLTSAQAFHKQVALNILGRVMDSMGNLIKDPKSFTRNMYVDMLYTKILRQL